MKTDKPVAWVTKITTNAEFRVSEVTFAHEGIRCRIGRMTGEYHPVGSPWCASIFVDIDHYNEPERWNYAHGAYAPTPLDAIQNAMLLCERSTVVFPVDWLPAVQAAFSDAWSKDELK